MKNRTKQRINRRMKEEQLSYKDSCGVNDPTPYKAVKQLIKYRDKPNS